MAEEQSIEEGMLLDTQELARAYFQVDLTETQADIVKAIYLEKTRRLVISAFTRFGKSLSVAVAILLYIRFNKNKTVLLIAPTIDQTNIIRNYIGDFIIGSPLEDLVELDMSRGIEGMKREVSKRRITFKNGCELLILSAEGTAQRLMGFGGDLIILDESCLIDHEVYRQRISRMLGDSPDAMLVEIGNPWHKLNHMWEHWTNPQYTQIEVPWQVGIEEGRITMEHVETQRRDLTELEFTVLYDAKFPDTSEGALLKWSWIENAFKQAVPKHYKIKHKYIGCDIAEGGRDWTVVTCVIETTKGDFIITDIQAYHQADTMITAGHIAKIQKTFKADQIRVDATGVGKGPGDRLAELGLPVQLIKVGSKATKEAYRFSNLKAQLCWNLRELFEEGRVFIPKHPKLIRELDKILFEETSSQKIKIPKPKDKSPDYFDSLMLGLAQKRSSELMFVNIK